MMNFDVFISYPSQYKAAADAVCAALEAEGIRCWIAPRDIAPGAEWAESIVDAIDHCRLMILVFSSSANRSRQIHREVQQAFDKEVPVVPLRIENVSPERSLAYYMGPVHWLDALTPPLEQHLHKLAQSVTALLQADGADGTPTEERRPWSEREAQGRSAGHRPFQPPPSRPARQISARTAVVGSVIGAAVAVAATIAIGVLFMRTTPTESTLSTPSVPQAPSVAQAPPAPSPPAALSTPEAPSTPVTPPAPVTPPPQPAPPVTMHTGLLGYWPFNGIATDASGNGNTLVLNGSAVYGTGMYDQALSLNGVQGSNAQARTNNTAFDFGLGDFTIRIWVKFNNITNRREETLIEKFTGGGGPGWTFTLQNGNNIQFYSPVTSLNSGPRPIPNGAWQQFVVERSGNTFSIYWDGLLVVSQTISVSLPPSPNPLLIGARNSRDGRNFTVDGLIDEVAIWNRALSSAEIVQDWNGGYGILLSSRN
jgi:hypothetical protein